MLLRKENENEFQHHKRLVCGKLIDRTITDSYSELSSLVYGKTYSEDVARRMMYGSAITLKLVDKFNIDAIDSQSVLDEIDAKIFDLKVERKKMQRINHEYNRNVTKAADVSLTKEQILESISNLKPITIPQIIIDGIDDEYNTAVVCIADTHYGEEFEIKNAMGEIVNKYSPEIFKERMWQLLADISYDLKQMKIKKIKVIGLGDSLGGVLRATSSLQQLKVGVVDGSMEYAEFMAVWLSKLNEVTGVPIQYSAVGGNHTVLRLLSSKPDFPNEQMEKVIHQLIELRLKDVEGISVMPYSDVIIEDIDGTSVMYYHGNNKDLSTVIEFQENQNNCKIDMVITGHMHSKSVETIGIGSTGDRELIRTNSIIGQGEYSNKILRSSRAGAEVIIFNNRGRQWSKTFYLN